MSYWIRKTKRPLVYHLTDKCSMVRHYPECYVKVDTPPAGVRACTKKGPCRG